MRHNKVTAETAKVILVLLAAGMDIPQIYAVLQAAGITISLRHTYRLVARHTGQRGSQPC